MVFRFFVLAVVAPAPQHSEADLIAGFTDKAVFEYPYEGNRTEHRKNCCSEEDEEYRFYLGVKVPITTLCPCSKEISDNGAHNQRALVSVKITYPEDEHIWLEDLVKDIEQCASCELYPLLKREDEKYVTEHAYNNPKFVEDILRDVVLVLRENPIIDYFEVECESLESIHNHSAWAYQQEG